MERSFERPGRAAWARPPQGWNWVSCPGQLLAEEGLRHILREMDWGLVKREETGLLLAFPWSSERPFPIPPLFCLARTEAIEGERFVLFRFSRRGWPEPLHKISIPGDNRGGI